MVQLHTFSVVEKYDITENVESFSETLNLHSTWVEDQNVFCEYLCYLTCDLEYIE